MNRRFLSVSFLSLFLFCCTPRDNPYDPENPDFNLPVFSARLRFYNQETNERLKNIMVKYFYNGKQDSATSDTNTGIALLCIRENLAEEQVSCLIQAVTSANFRSPPSFALNLAKSANDSDIGLSPLIPTPVSNIHVEKMDSLGIQLNWKQSLSRYFKYYMISRNASLVNIMDTLAILPSRADTGYLDSTVKENTQYAYTVNIMDVDDHFSSSETLKIESPNFLPPPVRLLEVKGVDFISLKLLWNKCDINDFSRYVVFRGPDSTSFDSISCLVHTTDTFWIDRSLDSAAKTYYYYIRVVDTGSLAENGNIMTGLNRTSLDSGMVLVDGGWFTMGENNTTHLPDKPEHNVFVSPFLMDRYETSVDKYARFLNSSKGNVRYYSTEMEGLGLHKEGDSSFTIMPGKGDFPIAFVEWDWADAYCRAMGGRLPTEAEWEKAARGTDKRQYPWGNDFYSGQLPPNYYLANYIVGYGARTDSGFSDDGEGLSAQVGRYVEGISPYGVYDLSGNVREWCGDWYGLYDKNKADSLNPTGPQIGLSRVVRGGGFMNYAEELKGSYRLWEDPTARKEDIGFRCIRLEEK